MQGLFPLVLSLSCSHAQAACSKPLQAPVAPISYSVIVQGAHISGVYIDILRALKNCEVVFTPTPRARAEALFESGKADLLFPATKTPKRDEYGVFVPLVAARATIISPHVKLGSLQAVLEQKNLRAGLVRGFDYGAAYQEFLKNMEKQGRLTLESDTVNVARLMQAGLIDLTVMAPSIFVPVVSTDIRSTPLLDKLQFTPAQELPWGESGIYISKTMVNAQDMRYLQEGLQNLVQSGQVWRSFLQYYKPDVLEGSIKPRHKP
ncbi:hypothetical protein V8J88_12420 [Massilia sp. W12]|uniref:substrate-binding periplasmic protein n=1 Tax=Massilia sp. W12 TaxID=3126507 RepID=UPI0030D6235D